MIKEVNINMYVLSEYILILNYVILKASKIAYSSYQITSHS